MDHDFTIEGFNQVLKMVDQNKSSALTDIRTGVIVDAFSSERDRVLHLYNLSTSTSTFPKKWKTGTVVSHPKINNPKCALYMRPISLMLIPG